MKKILLFALLVLSAACANRHTSDEVNARIAEEKASGQWDLRPEIALANRLSSDLKKSCDELDIKVNKAVTIYVPEDKENTVTKIYVVFQRDRTYQAVLQTIEQISVDISHLSREVLVTGSWIAQTDYALNIKGIGIIQFDESMTKGTIKFAGDPISSMTKATEGTASIDQLKIFNSAFSNLAFCQ